MVIAEGAEGGMLSVPNTWRTGIVYFLQCIGQFSTTAMRSKMSVVPRLRNSNVGVINDSLFHPEGYIIHNGNISGSISVLLKYFPQCMHTEKKGSDPLNWPIK